MSSVTDAGWRCVTPEQIKIQDKIEENFNRAYCDGFKIGSRGGHSYLEINGQELKERLTDCVKFVKNKKKRTDGD